MSETKTPAPAVTAPSLRPKPTEAKKTRQQRIREAARGIFEKIMAFKTRDLHQDMINEAREAEKQKRDPVSLQEFKQRYVQASAELSDMAITAAAAFDASWERVKGKYKEQEE